VALACIYGDIYMWLLYGVFLGLFYDQRQVVSSVFVCKPENPVKAIKEDIYKKGVEIVHGLFPKSVGCGNV
jgi:hypothetical protein